MNVTALVMSQIPYTREWPGLTVKVLEGRVFRHAADHQRAWNDAIAMVDTEYFCFLDDGADRLAEDYLDVIAECIATGADLSYTDELLDLPDGTQRLNQGQPYTQATHLARPMLIHHLAVCRTSAARAALPALPIGHFWPEMLLYWQMAKANTPAYVPRMGYVWNVGLTGLHTQPFALMAQGRSQRWCKANP